MNDLRYACRQLRKSPAFTAVAVGMLALGVGAVATVFSWIRTALVDILPQVREQHRLVVICPRHASGGLNDTCSYPEVQALSGLTTTFAGVVASQLELCQVRAGGASHWLWAQPLSVGALDTLGLTPERGRGFVAAEERLPGGHPVAMVSHDFWQDRLAGRPEVVGMEIAINNRPFTIVGVMPRGFQGTMGGLKMQMWIPLMMHRTLLLGPDDTANPNSQWLHALARLQPGITLAEAQAAVDALSAQLANQYPDSNAQVSLQLIPLWRSPYGAQGGARPLLQALAVVAVLVLLLVAANLAGLQLVRGADRAREIALRFALGASRGRVLRQLCVESSLLAVMGCGLGVVLAAWAVGLLDRVLPPTHFVVGYDFALRLPAVVAAVAAAAVAVVLFGVVPALQIVRVSPHQAMKEGAAGGLGAGSVPAFGPVSWSPRWPSPSCCWSRPDWPGGVFIMPGTCPSGSIPPKSFCWDFGRIRADTTRWLASALPGN